ncbi:MULTISPECIES: hypothetical protein [unclassified Yoonia]|uniref:hypothetical protein n=1 Tax=unclassified Yoonia TaxID=2629118 RepID=UPI002AFFB95F|nr:MULTISPECIES: hypothetical protein [unclassified Yoonia]
MILPLPAEKPVRVLFVFAWLGQGEEKNLIRHLAQGLDRRRFRIDALPCLRLPCATDADQSALRAVSIDVDLAAYDLSFDRTISYLERKITGYEIIVACQNVADIYPALDRLRHRPPLIEYGQTVREAAAGPKHLTTRYVGTTDAVRAVASARMPDRPHHASTIAPPWQDSTIRAWAALFDEVVAQTPAPPPDLFTSFIQGGFECSAHKLHHGRRLDIIAATAHDIHAESDYRQLGQFGMRTLRDGARWHLIEAQPNRYDFASFLPMMQAAQRSGTQVIWDLLHYGWPDDIDIWSPAFVDRFGHFAGAVAKIWRENSDQVPFWCPINEISFFSWAGGEVGYMNPFASTRGFELKAQLARASIAAMHALRDVDPRARFVHCEPLIAVHHSPASGLPRADAEGWHQAQFQAFDLLSGRIWPQLGGDPSLLDIIGVNYYPRNQWIHGGGQIAPEDTTYRPLSDLLFETYARYQRPLFVSETGTEDDHRARWFRYVASEVMHARQRGIPVEGLCLYPILNHPGWDDDRDCHNGLLTLHFEGAVRGVDAALATALRDFGADRNI